ncbi:MAG: PKD-like domain-containing protein, partial [Bacteroidota bacterium]
MCTRSIAQGVCASSAQATVFSIDFGNGSSTNSIQTVPTGFITGYSYPTNLRNNNPLSDGQYILTARGDNAFKADWAQLGDHTDPSNKGNMFLVNAGIGNSDLFFSRQVDNLCPGSTFSFSAWLANMNTTSGTLPICGTGYKYPSVIFLIKDLSGNILKQFTTGNLPLTPTPNSQPLWQQYGTTFSLPAGTTSLKLEMRDANGSATSYCGNDLALDDIVFSSCQPTATVTLSSASAICSGTSTTISSSLVNSPYNNPAYQWQKSTNSGSSWSNIGTAGTSANNFPIASALVSDAGMYRVVVGPDVSSLSSTTCTTVSNSITLTVNASPTAAISSNSPICSGNSITLTGTPSGGTSPYTYNWSGPNSFSSTSQNPSIANATAAASGSYSFTVTDSKSCTATATSNITVNQTPVVAAITNISGTTGGCKGTSFTLSNTTPGGVWSSSNTAIATVNSGGVVTITGGGSATISYTVTNAGCSAATTLVVTGAGVALHPDWIECNTGISHFDANDADYGVTYTNVNAGSTYLWSVTGGPFSYQGSSSATSQYLTLQMQVGYSYQVIAQVTTNGLTCSDTQMVYKKVASADTIQGSRDTTVCFNSAPIALVGKASPVANVFSWTTTGSGTFSNPTALSTTYTLSTADKAGGVIKIYLSATSNLNSNGNCGSTTAIDSMTLRVYPNNTGTNATQTICSNQALNFTPVAAIPGSVYSWISSVNAGSATGNTASGTGNIIDSLVNLSPVNNAVIVYTITPYAFTPSNITCTGTPFAFTVTVNPKPAVTITNNAPAICTGASTNIQFSSSIAGSSYTWSSSAVTGTITGNSANAVPGSVTTINDILTNNTTSNLTERYRITATSPLGCSRTDSTDVLVYGMPTVANAGPDQALCNVTNALLSANSPVLGTGSWSMISGPSTVNFGAISSTNSSVTNLVPGTYVLAWTIRNGSCLASQATVTLVNAAPTVAGTVSSNTTVCSGVNSGTLSLTGYTGNVVRWESSTDGGATWPTVINNTTASYTYNNLTASTYYRAVVQSGGCNAANASPASITVDPTTIPGTLSSSISVCAASNSGTLTLSGNNGTIVRWESSTDGGTTWPTVINNTTNSYDYTNLTVTTLFRVIVQSGNCSAVASNAVTITVNPQTVPGTLNVSTSVCATANAGTLTLTGNTGAVVRWESSIDNGSTWNNILNTTSTIAYNNLSATTQYRVSVQSGVCAPQYSNIATITVLQAVSAANAGADQVLCSTTSATLNAVLPTSGTGKWTVDPSNPTTATFTDANDRGTSVNGLTTGIYQFIWTVSNGLCATSQDIVQITVNPQTVPGTLAASATVCATGNAGTLTLTGYTSAVVRWESSIDNGSTWNNILNTTSTIAYNNLTETTQYRVSVQSGVCAPQYSNIATITVLQAVSAANAGADQ